MKTKEDNQPWANSQKVVLVIVAFLAFGIGYWHSGGDDHHMPDGSGHGTASERTEAALLETAENLVYVCPMSDIPPMAQPGTCPICGMELLPVAAPPVAMGDGTWRTRLDPAAVKAAGIRVAAVERKPVSADVRLFGRIEFDPAHTTQITAFTPGVIDRLYVKRTGQFVRWGAPLFDIYSSDLLETQREIAQVMPYVPGFLSFQSGAAHSALDAPVQARPRPGTSGISPETEKAYKILEGIRHKLTLLGLPKRDIDSFMTRGEATGIATVYASMYGQVVEQNTFEGTFVNVGTPIITLADPQFVWARMDAYEIDYPWIRQGQAVTFETDAYPGERFEAKIVNIDPVFNTRSRTFSIGAICADHGGRLKSGMLIRAVIHARLSPDGKVTRQVAAGDRPPLVVPASAPLITGRRSIVYVLVPGGEGVFEGREVLIGPKSGDYYVILEGLAEGDLVVVNGAFKIDSAVQIVAGRGMLGIEGGHSVLTHQSPGGSDGMHEDYLQQRTENLTGEKGRPEQHQRERTTIQRRRPGAYGEITGRPRPNQ
jgi:Cu(I)/Ag(I) efflux system membrane fusion protein